MYRGSYIGSIPVRDSDFFFVLCSGHVDQIISHFFTDLKIYHHSLFITTSPVYFLRITQKRNCLAFGVYKGLLGLSVTLVVCLRPVRNVSHKPTMQQTSHANDFVNAKSDAREKPLLTG